MDEVGKVREKTDVVSLISEYIPLKKMGRNFKTVCPFHSEKTPSFVVSPERQIWHCFGCGKGGDVFTFLMEYENMEFVEALRFLAKKAGIELSETGFTPGVSSKRDKIFNLNKTALNFYHYLLTRHPVGEKALSYLIEKRKLTPALIETFSLGFSPGNGTALFSYLINKKRYKREDLADAGLTTYVSGRVLDFFRGRIMFPLFDHRDNVVGFSARLLDDIPGQSKYVNTKETLVYHKGDLFFGLNSAKDEIKNKDQAIIVEGELDVISCFANGIKNAVAIKGTALTENQAKLIARFASKITLCLDQDVAGLAASIRSLPLLEKQGLTTTIVTLVNGKDPDDALKTDPSSFKKALKNDEGIYDFLLSKFMQDFNKDEVEGKKKITDRMLPLLSNIQNEIVKEHYIRKTSREIDASEQSLQRQMEKLEKKEDSQKQSSGISKKDKRERKEIVEEYLMALIVQSSKPNEYLKQALDVLAEYEFENPVYSKIIGKLSDFLSANEKFNSSKFAFALAKELIPTFDTWFLFPLSKFEDEDLYQEELIKISKELKTLYLRKKMKEITEKLRSKDLESEKQEILKKKLFTITTLMSSS